MIEVKYPSNRKKKSSFIVNLFKRLITQKPLGVIGGFIILILFFTAVFAKYLAPYGLNEIHMASRLKPPSPQFLLGTDNLGRDVLSRLIYGAQISMYVSLGATIIAACISTLLGVITGYLGGWLDAITQRFVDAFMSFPPLFFYLTVMAVLGGGLLQVILVLGVAFGIVESRIIRSVTFGIRANVYVEAGESIGAPTWRIILRHLLPNLMPTIIILTTIRMGSLIIQEATLSFLGFGVPPPAPSWGGMLSGTGRQYMFIAPWIGLWPGIALGLSVWGINMFGDAMRDLLDPRLSGISGRYGKTIKRKNTSKMGSVFSGLRKTIGR